MNRRTENRYPSFMRDKRRPSTTGPQGFGRCKCGGFMFTWASGRTMCRSCPTPVKMETNEKT